MIPRPLKAGLIATALAAVPIAAFAADIDKGLAKAPAVAVPAMNGMPLVIKREGGGLTVNGAHVIKGPMKVDSGLVYVIDAVLVPPMPIQPRFFSARQEARQR